MLPFWELSGLEIPPQIPLPTPKDWVYCAQAHTTVPLPPVFWDAKINSLNSCLVTCLMKHPLLKTGDCTEPPQCYGILVLDLRKSIYP